jgi:DNA-binding FrmR family transcriptional regulator
MAADDITNRLRRIEGQIRGLQRMLEDERDCEAVLTQLMAARAALDRVGLLVVNNYVRQCMSDPTQPLSRDQIARVLEVLLSRFSVPPAPDDPNESWNKED